MSEDKNVSIEITLDKDLQLELKSNVTNKSVEAILESLLEELKKQKGDEVEVD